MSRGELVVGPEGGRSREALRRRAEELLARTRESLPEGESDEVGKLVHELQVYQAELEIQNDELRQAQEAQELSGRRHRDLFDFAPIGYFCLDANGAILEANLAGAELLEVDRRFLHRKPFTVFLPAEHHEAFLLHRQRVLASTGRQSCQLELKRRDGTSFPVQVEASVLLDETGSPTYSAAVIDLTDRVRAEEERDRLEANLRKAQRLEALGTLAGGIAHDFNNILTPIFAHGELALMGLPEGSPVREDVALLLAAAERAAALVRQILSVSRKDDLAEKVPVNLSEVVRDVSRLLRSTLPPSLKVQEAVTAGLRPVKGSPTELFQVLLNLCTNARDALEGQGGRLKIELKAAEEPGWLNLSVSDTGAGMAPDVLKRIFDPYFTTKPKGRGTGLGLAVAQRIVEKMGGEIRVRSTPGSGSTFEVLIPEHVGGGDGLTAPGALPGRASGHRVLVVDDESLLLQPLGRMLSALGYEPEVFTSPRDALSRFREEPGSFSLVLTDHSMPEMTGFDVAAEVIRLRPGLPILLGTGLAEGLAEDAVAERGLSGLVPKPYTLRSLRAALHRALEGAPAEGPGAAQGAAFLI